MRSFLYVLTALGVIGLAFWAYTENYRTKEAQARASAVQDEIAQARQRLRMLRAEWAYLNRPDRLRELADINFERLGLLPLEPYQFGNIDQVPYPPEPEPAMAPEVEPGVEPAEPGAETGLDTGSETAPAPAGVTLSIENSVDVSSTEAAQ